MCSPTPPATRIWAPTTSPAASTTPKRANADSSASSKPSATRSPQIRLSRSMKGLPTGGREGVTMTSRRGSLTAVLGLLVLLTAACSGGAPASQPSPPSTPAAHPAGGGAAAGMQPVGTADADWQPVVQALGRPGKLSSDGLVYRVSFPRSDLTVTSKTSRSSLGSRSVPTRLSPGTQTAS